VGPLTTSPIADPDSTGRVAVQRTTRFWLEAYASSRLSGALPYHTAVHSPGSDLAYVDALEPAAARRRPMSNALPGAATRRAVLASIRWALFGTDVSPWSFDAANVPLGQVRAIDVALPPELRRFLDAGFPGWRLPRQISSAPALT
jgi:hypothetical protein